MAVQYHPSPSPWELQRRFLFSDENLIHNDFWRTVDVYLRQSGILSPFRPTCVRSQRSLTSAEDQVILDSLLHLVIEMYEEIGLSKSGLAHAIPGWTLPVNPTFFFQNGDHWGLVGREELKFDSLCLSRKKIKISLPWRPSDVSYHFCFPKYYNSLVSRA